MYCVIALPAIMCKGCHYRTHSLISTTYYTNTFLGRQITQNTEESDYYIFSGFYTYNTQQS